MKLRKLSMLLVVPCFGLWACEEAPEAPTDEAPAVDAAAPDAAAAPAANAAPAEVKPGPAEVCGKLVEAAKAKDAEAFAALCTAGAGEAMAGEGVKEAMFAKIGEVACGEAEIAEGGTTATVKATAGEQERAIPFSKVEEDWKFDYASYIAKYPATQDAGKGKKKGQKGKKKAGKKAKNK
ncbi:MAG: hypothetical protein A2289_09105 [Deltaproteobacteria bacterium RIFOXYA12_FULL_58_15]|nr:MAG: hypothetical protein A2289_09105 [Deltaproteobacteria bacterium RIFOXYA12_FULL_58_15]OGR09650.1 MAG: hypothetical protein A2341_14745 [Deltaproteobacteria bacterium RIFOXYB12_FULL_58_9]